MKKIISTELNRRSFLVRSVMGLAAAIGADALLSACGSNSTPTVTTSGGTPTSGGNCGANGSQLETTGVTEGHDHTIQLTATQINAANTSAIFTTSSVGHTHPVQLTSAQYASLASNTGISLNTGVASDGDGHFHSLTINCG